MIRLRPYNPNDADIILSWSRDERTFYKWSAGILGEYPISREQFGQVNDFMAFTALDNDEPAGFFVFKRPTESFDVLRFCLVIVDPEKRGKGYGKAMLQLGIKFAKDIFGAKKLSLGVFDNNKSACCCYKALGFEEAASKGTKNYFLLGEEWKCLELEMDL